MEFLVEIEVCWPADGDPSQHAALVEAEAARAAELAAEGRIVRLWRIPGRRANVGLWSATDAHQLHEALASLPFFPWLDINVRPLAQHSSDPQRTRS